MTGTIATFIGCDFSGEIEDRPCGILPLKGGCLPFYLLTPIHLGSRDWLLSTTLDPVQVEASSEEEARLRAAGRYAIAAKVQAGSPTTLSPWSQPELVVVKEIKDPDPALPLLRLNDAL